MDWPVISNGCENDRPVGLRLVTGGPGGHVRWGIVSRVDSLRWRKSLKGLSELLSMIDHYNSLHHSPLDILIFLDLVLRNPSFIEGSTQCWIPVSVPTKDQSDSASACHGPSNLSEIQVTVIFIPSVNCTTDYIISSPVSRVVAHK